MPAGHICDGGCGHAGPIEDFTELGKVRKRSYCKNCVDSVKAYLDALDELHIAVANSFKEGRDKMVDEWQAKFPGGKLPS